MNIVDLRTTPLFCRFKQPYHWARGVNHGAHIILIEVLTDAGIIGIGECVVSPTTDAVLAILRDAAPHFVGQSAYDGNRLIDAYYRTGFNSRGTASAPRYFAQALAGIELALWDAIGKAANQPLHRLLGGAVRDKINYFGFIQGDAPEELAAHASELLNHGFSVFYVKVGRGEELDMSIVRAVRRAIGTRRLRLDANEAWDTLTARRMFAKLAQFDLDFIEQPLRSPGGAESLAKLRAVVQTAIAADQAAYTPEDVYEICRAGAADVIVLGMHETCGVLRFLKAAAIAEAANVNICIHGVFETGITTCASNQVAATIRNLDDGNQIMWQLLAEDIVAAPALTPKKGSLPISMAPGLGFELNRDAVARAAEAYEKLL
jgi:muconate cycloisomerase